MTHETACIVALIGNIVAVLGGARTGEEASIPSVTRTKALALGSYIVTCAGRAASTSVTTDGFAFYFHNEGDGVEC